VVTLEATIVPFAETLDGVHDIGHGESPGIRKACRAGDPSGTARSACGKRVGAILLESV